MSAEARFKEIIEADVPDTGINDLLTGGVYSFTELGETGFVPNNVLCADAFEKVRDLYRVKPSIVIRVTTNTPNYERADVESQTLSYSGTVQFWIYQYRFYDQIALISDALETLFRFRVYADLGYVRPLNTLEGLVAPEFASTSLQRDDYQFKGTR